jgi:YVTN family beta-propeller protein
MSTPIPDCALYLTCTQRKLYIIGENTYRPHRLMIVVGIAIGLLISVTNLTTARAYASTINGITTVTIPVGNFPDGVAVDPSNHNVYVANVSDNTVSVIDESNDSHRGTVTATIPVGNDPTAVAVDPTNHNVYVTTYDQTMSPQDISSVSVIDESGDANSGRVTATIPVGNTVPSAIAVDPTNHNVYVTTYGNPSYYPGSVWVIDEYGGAHSGTVTATIPVGDLPYGVAVDPTNHNVYATNAAGNTVSVIDESGDARTGTVTATIPARSPDAVAVDPTNHNVYVTDLDPRTVSVIDESGDARTGTVTATIPVGLVVPPGSGEAPFGVAVDPSTHNVYVANRYYQGTISVIDESGDSNAGTVTSTLPAGDNPGDVAVDPTSHNAYVTDTYGDTVELFRLTPPADLVTAITSPPSASDGSRFTEAVTVTNNGPSAAASTVTNVLIPRGLTVTSAPGATRKTGSVVFHDRSLTTGTTVTYKVSIAVAAGVHATTAIGAVAESDDYDPHLANNAAISVIRLG